jgi:uncharacterized protein (TIGR02757 family)
MVDKARLDELRKQYNRRKYVHPDPLEFLYRYPDMADREVAALLASCLAYGRVRQILKSVAAVLDPIGDSPRAFLQRTSPDQLLALFAGFKHRFTTGPELVDLLKGITTVAEEYGTLNNCFVAGQSKTDVNVFPAMTAFVDCLGCGGGSLVPLPARGSSCKRLNLFLRWMVRKDSVDPGGWTGVPKSKLIVPLDTHMARIGRDLLMTTRQSPNRGMAIEITEWFKTIAPRDPVKYDFALTRFGIRDELEVEGIAGEA